MNLLPADKFKVIIKACAKCNGDLALVEDPPYSHKCVQCGQGILKEEPISLN